MKLLVFVLVLMGFQVNAQVVQNFDLTNVVDGNSVSLKNYISNPAVVIIIHTVHCPYSDYYLNRIKTLAETYKSKVPVILINASLEENESVKEMTEYANKNKIIFPYLADKEHKVFLNLNPVKSPEVFLLKNSSDKFTVAYHGAIDDNPSFRKDMIDK